MNGWAWFGIGLVAWGLLLGVALLWVRGARDAGERFDQVMRDHYSDSEDDQ